MEQRLKYLSFLKITLLTFIIANSIYAQDLPVLLQRNTDGQAYNPSVSGLYGSSYDFAFQNKWAGIGEPYSLAYLSMQTPLSDGSIGAAFNVFYEKVNLLRTVDLSAALAYHFLLDNNMVVSLGLNAEYGNTSLDIGGIDVIDPSDPVFDFAGVNKFDFSFGTNFRTNYFQFGASANRLLTLLKSEENKKQNDLAFQEFFTAYAVGFLPTSSGRDMLELRANYRQLLNRKNLVDLGAFYEYNKKFMLGANYRTNSSFHVAASVTLMDNFSIGYAREVVVGEFSGQLGASDEITLRYTFDQVQSILNNTRGNAGDLGRIGGSINRLNTRKGKYSGGGRKRINGNSKRERNKMRNYKGRYKNLLPPSKRKKKKFLGIF
ncbi:MAG: PorP/SprF family type IX secretion system membrane protein [Bacteroidota bacterium]